MGPRATSLVLSLLVADGALALGRRQSPSELGMRGTRLEAPMLSAYAGKDLTATKVPGEAQRTNLSVRSKRFPNFLGELMSHGLVYITWLYIAAFGAYSLRMYCVSCETSNVKQAIPAMFVMQLLAVAARFKADPSSNRPTDAVATMTHYGVSAFNIFGAALVFADMLRCFLRQVSA